MRKTATITEVHSVTVETNGKKIVFNAEPDKGRLVIREEEENGEEICSLTLSNPEELGAFFDGLRRVFLSTREPEVTGSVARAQQLAPPPARSLPQSSIPQGDRDEVITRARERNPNAFKGWNKAEEAELRQRFQKGEPIQKIARALQRSEKAIEMRLKRMGLLGEDGTLITGLE